MFTQLFTYNFIYFFNVGAVFSTITTMKQINIKHHEGNNYGDKLNVLIFKNFLPNATFDAAKSDITIVGIGTLFGFNNDKNDYFFSTGVSLDNLKTYGDPRNMNSVDRNRIFCVRGPKTAKVLGICEDKVVVDGAVLIREILIKSANTNSVFFIPHLSSNKRTKFYLSVCRLLGIEIIDPRDDIIEITKKISGAKKVIAEAMHGAIVADSYGVHWVPISTSKAISNFKWEDFSLSLCLKIKMNKIPTIYSRHAVREKLASMEVNSSLIKLLTEIYLLFQFLFIKPLVIIFFIIISKKRGYLSSRALLNKKIGQLKEMLKLISKDKISEALRYTSI